jgi:transposase
MEQIYKTVQSPNIEELCLKITALEQENAYLRRMIFGQKSERFISAAHDKQLPLPGLDQPSKKAQAKTETINYTRKKRENAKITPHGRSPLPAHLRRVEKVIEPAEDISNCKVIGKEVTETLEYKQPELYVLATIRYKYAKPDGEGVIIAPLPSMPIPKCQAGASLLSHLMVAKFVDHMPFYRQRQKIKRTDDYDIPSSTINGWNKATGDLLEPLEPVLREHILKSTYLQVDETPLRVQDPSLKGKCHTGYLWPYLDPIQGICLFDYQPTRGRAGPSAVLEKFSGALQADGYEGYNQFKKRDGITLLGCFVHSRRYFEKALGQDKERASWMLEAIQKLYHVEKEASLAKLSFEDRYTLRREKSAPVMADIKDWLQKNGTKVTPASLIGKAINYTVGMWPRLERYMTDGRFEIDNNLIENAIRPIAIGRKNYMFAGSHDAAKRAALVYSLVTTARYHDVNPEKYLEYVIQNISDYPYHKLADLLPQNWKSLSANQSGLAPA